MDEIKRLQQLAGIITEIKVNNPNKLDLTKNNGEYDYVDTDIVKRILMEKYPIYEDEIDSYCADIDETSGYENIGLKDLYEDFEIYLGYIDDDELDEDVSDFNIGQSSETGGRRTTVTDIDPETQSVTWSVKKEVDDSTIHKDLTDLINKFEKVQLKDFHSRPKLIQLVKDLKSIRNKFSRTVVKEDYKVLKENLVGLLNEIKVNNPLDYEKIFDECWGKALEEIGEFIEGNNYEDEEIDNEDEVSLYARELFKQRTGKNYDDLI